MLTLKSFGVSCLALLLLLAGGTALADERVEKTLTLEEALPAGGELHFWNLIGSVEVLLPLLAYLLAGERAFAALECALGWLERNNVPAIVTVVSVIGAVLVINGVRGLT